MSFNIGDLITATKMNDVNSSNGCFSGSLASGKSENIASSIGNSGIFYSYRIYNSTLFYYKWKNGAFGGGHLYVDYLVNGSWNNYFSKSYGWNTNVEVNVPSKGEGWYRIRGDDIRADRIPWTIWYGQNDCNAGDYIVEHNNKFTGGIKVSDNPNHITADLLNTGIFGTTPSLT